MLLCRHSREGGARSEALALSSNYKRFWMPASAGMTGFGPFYECVSFNWLINIKHEPVTSHKDTIRK